MLDSIPISIAAGIVLGYLAGLGVGGGSLLILWLTLILEMDHSTARMINLLFFLPAAGTVSLFRWKQGNLHLRAVLPAIAAGCTAAAVFSWIGMRMDMEPLKKLFGVLLLITGIKELCYRPRKAK